MVKKIIIIVVLCVVVVGIWFAYQHTAGQKKVILSADVMVERITDMGKLELVKYAMKDVIEHKELRSFYLLDQRVLFVAAGEVVGCIDLTKVTTEDIERHSDDSLTIYLPAPEICYVKLDHERSRVYDVSGAWWPGDTQRLVEEVYKVAERRLLENAREMDVLGKTKENAQSIFKPFLENIVEQQVNIAFR